MRDIIFEDIQSSINHAVNPYADFNNCKLEDYQKQLINAGFEPKELDNPSELFIQLRDDLIDDKNNCGGSVLSRMYHVAQLVPIFSKEDRDEILKLMAEWLRDELTGWVR